MPQKEQKPGQRPHAHHRWLPWPDLARLVRLARLVCIGIGFGIGIITDHRYFVWCDGDWDVVLSKDGLGCWALKVCQRLVLHCKSLKAVSAQQPDAVPVVNLKVPIWAAECSVPGSCALS